MHSNFHLTTLVLGTKIQHAVFTENRDQEIFEPFLSGGEASWSKNAADVGGFSLGRRALPFACLCTMD